VIVVRLADEDQCRRAAAAVAAIPGVDGADGHGAELSIRARDGAAIVSPVAVALSAAGVSVRSLTLRTPSLDDVFLQLTGARIEENE
jgi:ABC-2 type transport system ATP-binding protein